MSVERGMAEGGTNASPQCRVKNVLTSDRDRPGSDSTAERFCVKLNTVSSENEQEGAQLNVRKQSHDQMYPTLNATA